MRSPWLTWTSLTYLGDSGLLLPAGLAIGIALLLTRGSRGLALRWALAFGLTGMAVLATKIAFIGWGIGNANIDFTGLSGHSALSAAFWPVAAWLASRNAPLTTRRVAIALGALLAVAIGVSRLMIHVHSGSEVLTGLMVGGAASAWFVAGTRQAPPGTPALSAAALAVVAAMIVLQHGRPAPTTRLIETTVVQLLGVSEPFTRRDLHRIRF